MLNRIHTGRLGGHLPTRLWPGSRANTGLAGMNQQPGWEAWAIKCRNVIGGYCSCRLLIVVELASSSMH